MSLALTASVLSVAAGPLIQTKEQAGLGKDANAFAEHYDPTRYPTRWPTTFPSNSPHIMPATFDDELAGVSVVFRPTLQFFFIGDSGPVFGVHNPLVWAASGWSGTKNGRITGTPEKVQFFPEPKKEHLLISCTISAARQSEVEKKTNRKTIKLWGRVRHSGLPNDAQLWYDRYIVKKDGMEALRVDVEGNGTSVDGTLALRIKEKKMTKEGYYKMVWVDGAPVVWQNNMKKSETIQVQYGHTVFRFKAQTSERRVKRAGFTDIVVPYTHLDATMDMDDGEQLGCKEGVIPELWGNVGMSDETKKMLRPPAGVKLGTHVKA